MVRKKTVLIGSLVLLVLAACSTFPGADGRYATHDRGAGNRGMARTGLPPTPYVPR